MEEFEGRRRERVGEEEGNALFPPPFHKKNYFVCLLLSFIREINKIFSKYKIVGKRTI